MHPKDQEKKPEENSLCPGVHFIIDLSVYQFQTRLVLETPLQKPNEQRDIKTHVNNHIAIDIVGPFPLHKEPYLRQKKNIHQRGAYVYESV